MASRALKKPKSSSRIRRDIEDGSPLGLRIRVKKDSKGRMMTIRCGCCKHSIEVIGDVGPLDKQYSPIEINGIYASIEQWRKVLVPVLALKPVKLKLQSGISVDAWVTTAT